MKQKTILFLEDEAELLDTLAMLLREQGYGVIAVRGAEEAIEQLKTATPDLILADIKLPGIDGFDFFQQIQQRGVLRNVPFVFLTAFNNLTAAMDAKKKGAAEYITKPFDFEYLVTRVRELVPP